MQYLHGIENASVKREQIDIYLHKSLLADNTLKSDTAEEIGRLCNSW